MQTVDSAKEFLLTQLVEQASADDVALSDVEKRMFLFSEASSNPDWEANEQFESEYNDSQYEKKVAKLLQRAYAKAKKEPALQSAWKECLDALRDEDFYGLVMVDQANISRPTSPVVAQVMRSFLDVRFLLFAISELSILAVAFGILVNRIHLQFLSSDLLRLVSVFGLFAAAWGVGEVYGRIAK